MLEARIVTTSWDDGDIRDVRVAESLRSRELGGTFYIPIEPYQGRPALSRADLRTLVAEGFEIGAHGIAHENMARLSPSRLAEVVGTSKQILESALGEPVLMFCYPGGRHNRAAVRCLRDAGYAGGRTTRMLATRLDFSPFEMPVSLQVYPHPKTAYMRNAAKARNLGRFYRSVVELRHGESWLELGKRLFDRVLEEGGIWHLYGHSWEIEERGLWDELDTMLDYVCRREGVDYLSNGDAVSFVQSRRPAVREKQAS